MLLRSCRGIFFLFYYYCYYFIYKFVLGLQRFGILRRYDATTVLTLLQEVAHYSQPKIDWFELVEKSATGISNAREYQMLWRHLAYRHSLPENFEDGAEPLVCVTLTLWNLFVMLIFFRWNSAKMLPVIHFCSSSKFEQPSVTSVVWDFFFVSQISSRVCLKELIYNFFELITWTPV